MNHPAPAPSERVAVAIERLREYTHPTARCIAALGMVRGALWSGQPDAADRAREVLRALDIVTLQDTPGGVIIAELGEGNSGPGGDL
jgi:hypothetical protein